jgi:predicted kinase
VLIVMMGLPGSGKTTIARRLAIVIGGVIINKDSVREAMFAPPVLDYSSAQNDLCMEMVYEATTYILQKWPEKHVIIDGRTYSERRQVERLLEISKKIGVVPQCLECTIDEKVARTRLEESSSHPAKDRNFELYRTLRTKADPLEIPRLTLDTGKLSIERAVTQCLEYLQYPLSEPAKK